MALVKQITQIRRERHSIHRETHCTSLVFTDTSGTTYLQLDTYGSASRKFKEKVSQSLQFNREGAAALRAAIDEAFPDLAKQTDPPGSQE